MFTAANRFSQTPKKRQYYRPGSLLSILSAEQLLMGKAVRVLIQELKTCSQLPEIYFTTLYQEAIDRFAEMVQLLPFEEEGVLAGILNRGIARGVLGVRLYLSQFLQEQDPLTAYAIFTASLFFDLGKLLTHYTVVLVKKKTDEYELNEWQPFSGPMGDQAQYYKLFPKSCNSDLQHEVTSLFARQLLPLEGFLWITSDNQILNEWLLILRGGANTGTGRLCHIFSLIKHEDLQELLSALSQPCVEILEDPAHAEAEKFYHWLRENNNENVYPGVYFLDGQVYVSGQLLQDYIQIKKLQMTADQLRQKVQYLFSFIRNENNKIFRQVNHVEAVKQNHSNQKVNLGFLNHKKLIANGIALPANLILRRHVLQTSYQIHHLPLLAEKKERAVLRSKVT